MPAWWARVSVGQTAPTPIYKSRQDSNPQRHQCLTAVRLASRDFQFNVVVQNGKNSTLVAGTDTQRCSATIRMTTQLRSNNETPASLRSDGWQPCAGPGGRLQMEWVATFSGLRTMSVHGKDLIVSTGVSSDNALLQSTNQRPDLLDIGFSGQHVVWGLIPQPPGRP